MIGTRKLAVLAAAMAFAPVASASAGGETPMMVGGAAAPAHAWPSIAFLEGRFDDAAGNHHVYHCTGSVVAPAWIITAAHCAVGDPGKPPDSMDATLGVTDYSDPSRQVVAVDRFVPDPSYESEHDVNDVALLHLKQATSVPPMRLATRDESAAGRYISRPNVPNAAGWGAVDEDGSKFTTVLQQAYLQIQSGSECRDLVPGFDASIQACAGTADRAGVCFGDSGGPLVKFDATTQEPVLWGVTSSRPEAKDGEPPCSRSVPAEFTLIPAFADFIKSTLATAPDAAPSPTPDHVEARNAGHSVAPTVAAAPARCRRAQRALSVARTTERTLLRRLRAARRHRTGRVARRRVSHRFHAAHSRRLRIAATTRRACGADA